MGQDRKREEYGSTQGGQGDLEHHEKDSREVRFRKKRFRSKKVLSSALGERRYGLRRFPCSEDNVAAMRNEGEEEKRGKEGERPSLNFGFACGMNNYTVG